MKHDFTDRHNDIFAIIVALSSDGLRRLVNALDYNKVHLLGIVAQDVRTVNIQIDGRKVPVYGFSALRQVMQRYGSTVYYLLCGFVLHTRDLGDVASLMHRMAPEMPRSHIWNADINFSNSWMGNLRYAATEAIDFFATGISYTEFGVDIRQFPYKGVNLGLASQDLYNGYRTAKHVFEHHGDTIRFVLIGLCPYSFHYDIEHSFSVLGQRYQYDFVFAPEDDRPDHVIMKEDVRHIYQTDASAHPDPNNDAMRYVQEFLLFSGCGILNFKRELEDVTVRYREDMLKKNKGILRDYIQLCRQHHAVPIGVVFSFSICLRDAYPERDLAEFRSLLEDYQEMDGFDVIDLFDERWDETHFQNLSHVNSKGAARASAIIATRVKGILAGKGSEEYRGDS